MDKLERFKEIEKEINYLKHATALMNWDMETITPEGAKEKLSDAITYFSTKCFELITSDELFELVTALSEKEEFDKLDDVMKFDIKTYREDLEKSRRVPTDFYQEYIKTITTSSIAWPKAKRASDFSLYEKPLTDTIEAVKKMQKIQNPDKEVYDSLIDDYEKGMTAAEIDRVFGELREELVPLLEKILEKPQPDHSKFTMTIPAHKQAELCKFLVEYMGMDMDRFAQSESEHPFTTNMNSDDIRITNHYHENDVIQPIFSAIHEGGHALFEQHVDSKLSGTSGGTINLMGLHESQSRFYENILGRNINFWKPIWPKVLEIVPELSSVTLEEFVREINHVQNSFIRTEADELTYCLHVILRYEIERKLFNGEVEVKDLPKLWDDKMEELLHIRPSNDAEGILQDMHWSDGSFGYFPSYLLGSIYDGMFLEAMEKELGSIDDILANGEIAKISEWLKVNIHQYGSTRTSSEVLEEVCGQKLSAAPLIRYFKEKYTKVYNL
ncbi:carboxypeptidase M32 [Butyrivibrio proteoclasticus]|uniref:carboxypeptidase M32 n=1 Tax=Butyrivibrio proteoclasticus TaxID=43305 RepID=UPI00047DA831|nr:carboxypeptidase M32 [Butyrivibrio proteoclasticus]